jgi:excisionase family DNA binding protein
MPATQAPGFLRISEAAERLNVSRASVYRWIGQGRLPAVQLGGRGSPLRVPIGELEEWLALSHVTPAERRAPAAGQSIVRQLAGKEQP